MDTGKGLARTLAAASLLALCSGVAFADNATTQPVDLSAQIAAMQKQLDDLRNLQAEQQKQMQAKLDKQEQQQTANQVVQDAQKHDNLLDLEGFTGGYANDRFVLQSSDGNFSLRPWLHLQVRDVTLLRQDFKQGGTEDDVQNGFEIRRMRFGFDGNMFGPDLTYMINWATVRASGNATVRNAAGTTVGTVSNNLGGAPLLEEAWAKYHFHDTPFYIRGGQIKDPLMHDQIVSSRYQQGTERSLTADIFANGDAFTEGATLIYDPNSWVRTEGGINHGIRSANTNFLDYPNTNAFNYGVVGRAEFKMFGNWKSYSQMGAFGVKDPLLVFGAGLDYSERGHSGQTVGVFDATYSDPSGLSLYGAVVDRYTTHNFGIYTQSAAGASIGTPAATVANTATNEYAIVAQIGYLLPDKHWEPFGRYEYMRLQGTAAGSQNYVQDIVGGVNYYFVGHRAKLTAEVQYLPHGIPIDDTPNDILTSPNGRGELSFIAQFQLLL